MVLAAIAEATFSERDPPKVALLQRLLHIETS
jgi:hypothetical protein